MKKLLKREMNYLSKLKKIAHMDVIAESTAMVYDRRKKIKGLTMIYEPKYLRFFQARFDKL